MAGTKCCDMVEIKCIGLGAFTIKCRADNCPYNDRACPVPGNDGDIFTFTREN